MSGQTLHDRLTAAKHTLAGQGLARIVCKATTEEVIGPKKKHLDYLIHCTNEPNVSIPQLANLLIERTQHSSWVVVFKALITVHHLMCYGNERFTQYLASSNCTFQLSNFLDKSTVQGTNAAYDMSTFIRRYAKYLNEKALSYRTTAFDFCKVKRGKDDGMLRTMNTDKLLKTLPALQSQLDSLLEFDCTSNDLTNGVINSCFMLLFRDLIRLFACYNDGIINLLEKYFDMNKKNCREALDIYKKFLIRMDRVAEFLKVAENVGIDKGDIPDLTKAPSSLLDALEQHLATLEGKKGVTAPSSASRSSNLRNAVSALSSTSNAFGNAANGANSEMNGIVGDESALKALEEEASVMNQLKFDGDSPHNIWEQPKWDDVERRMKEIQTQQSTDGVTKTNPFLASPEPPAGAEGGGGGIVDLFSSPTGGGMNTTGGGSNKASDDLLCLSGNPFADSLFGGAPAPPQQPQAQFMAFGTNGFSAPAPNSSGFASDASFAAAFGGTADTSPTGSGLAPPASVTPEKDMLRGAGTTPILTQAPDLSFGDAGEALDDHAQQPSDVAWGTGATATQRSATQSPFGAPFNAPFEQAAAARAPSPAQTASIAPTSDLFGFEGGAGYAAFSNRLGSGLTAPPPSPFSGLDLSTGGSSPSHTTSAPQPPPQQQKSAFDDLNSAIQKAMQIPQSKVVPPQQPSQAPGPKPGWGGAQPMASPLGGPGGMQAQTPLFETLARASPTTSGYGTPPSGLCSPAKSLAGSTGSGFDSFSDVLQPTPLTGKAVNGTDPKSAANKLIKGDLDSSLASLAQNLDINGPKQSFKKPGGHQWGSPKVNTKTGGANWGGAPPNAAGAAAPAPAPGPAGPAAWGPPNTQQAFPPVGGAQWGGAAPVGMMAGPFSQQAAPAPGMMQSSGQAFGMGPMRPVAPAGMGLGMGMGGASGQGAQANMGIFGAPMAPTGAPAASAVNDPFGAL